MKFVCDDCGFEIEYDTIGKKYIECNKCGGAKGGIELVYQQNQRLDIELIDELKDMKNRDLDSINAVVWHLKKQYDKIKEK